MDVFENEELVRSGVPYKYSVGEPGHLQVGGCAYDVLDVTMETESLKGTRSSPSMPTALSWERSSKVRASIFGHLRAV